MAGVGMVEVGMVVAAGGLGFGGRAGGAELISKRLKSHGDPEDKACLTRAQLMLRLFFRNGRRSIQLKACDTAPSVSLD